MLYITHKVWQSRPFFKIKKFIPSLDKPSLLHQLFNAYLENLQSSIALTETKGREPEPVREDAWVKVVMRQCSLLLLLTPALIVGVKGQQAVHAVLLLAPGRGEVGSKAGRLEGKDIVRKVCKMTAGYLKRRPVMCYVIGPVRTQNAS